LPPLKKLSLKFHVIICPVCGKYNRQVMKFYDLSRNFRSREDELLEKESPDAPHLSESARKHLQEELERERRNKPSADSTKPQGG